MLDALCFEDGADRSRDRRGIIQNIPAHDVGLETLRFEIISVGPPSLPSPFSRIPFPIAAGSVMANPTQPGIKVISKDFKRDDNDMVLCTDRVEVEVSRNFSNNPA